MKFLIAQKEYLIALDATEILTGLIPADIDTCSMVELSAKLRETHWDLVLLDTTEAPDEDRRNASMVLASGAGLVFLTGYSEFAGGVPAFEEWPVVTKPFMDSQLLDAVLRSLHLVGKS